MLGGLRDGRGAARTYVRRSLSKLGPWAWVPESAFPQTIRSVVTGFDRKLGNVGGGCLAVVALALVGPMVVIGWSIFTEWAVTLWMLALLAATV